MLAFESQSRMTRRELLMTSISLVKDQVVLFLEMRPLCPNRTWPFRILLGKKTGSQGLKTGRLRGSNPNAASFFRQFHRSVAAAVKTGAARSSSQTYVVSTWQKGPGGLSSTSLTNWSDPRGILRWYETMELGRLSLTKYELYRTILMSF